MENYQNCSILCTTFVRNDTHKAHEQFSKMSVGLDSGLVFVHLFRLRAFCVFFF